MSATIEEYTSPTVFALSNMEDPGTQCDSNSTDETQCDSSDGDTSEDSRKCELGIQTEEDRPLMVYMSPPLTSDISALYGLLIVISALCLVPLAETARLQTDFLRWMEGGILLIALVFLMFVLLGLGELPDPNCAPKNALRRFSLAAMEKIDRKLSLTHIFHRAKKDHDRGYHNQSGSLYLKIGCMLFTIGSLMYGCITLGTVIENRDAFSAVMALNPSMNMVFQFLQLVYIFRNEHYTLKRWPSVGRFGLMHLIGCNMTICIRCIVDETLDEFHELAQENNSTQPTTTAQYQQYDDDGYHYSDNDDTGAYLHPCLNRDTIMCGVLESASPFLYPCIVEVSLLSAGIFFVIWKNINSSNVLIQMKVARQKRTTYRIDCDQALVGFFLGLLVLVATAIGLVLFSIDFSDPNPDRVALAVLQWQIMDFVLNCIGLVAVIICIVQFSRKMHKVNVAPSVNQQLDDALLLIAMVGIYAYSVLSLLALNHAAPAVLSQMSRASSFMNLIQATLQSIFLFDASSRVHDAEKRNYKPARQTVTLLLITNFSLWATAVFCALHTDATPLQRDFYGTQQWTIMLHVVVPLVIFYRFHSTACIFETWKRAFKSGSSPQEDRA